MDNGIVRVFMFGVYGFEGEWLIEGKGFVLDIELDNLLYEIFNGKDVQFDVVIKLLQEKIVEDLRDVFFVLVYLDKLFKNNCKK